MRKKYLYTAGIFLLLLVFSAGFTYFIVRKPMVRFSETEAFQEREFDLTLESGLFGGKIYYTLDGNTPTLESEVYTGPIHIEAGMPTEATVVKAAALMGGRLGEVCTQTYFVGEGVKELFDVMVVSLSADEEALYDEQTGILSNYEETGENGEWDRPAYVEFYEPNGKQMLAQGTGIAVSGHGSRGYDVKSIKLISDSVYDPDHPTFDYDFFETDMAGNTSGQSYNRLVLRNGGSDHYGTMLKWNVVSRLAKQCGVVCAGARTGVLFLNGEFYEVFQLQEKYTRYNVAHAIGAQKDDIEKYEPNEVNSSRFGGYYNRLHADLNDPERQQKLESSVDMPDMLRHYAVNLIMNNVDWPFHNFLSWKCAEGSFSPYGDGRVRFFLYDLDAVYQDTSGMENQNEFDYLMEETIEDMTDTLYLLMQSDKYRTQFVNMVCDLTSTVFAPDHVLEIIEEEDARLQPLFELYWTEDARKRQQEAVEEMKEAVASSCERVREGLKKHLGAEDPYTLNVQAPDGFDIVFDQIEISARESYSGTYYHNYPLTLTAVSGDGQPYYGWSVNGEVIPGAELLLDESYTEEELKIQLITETP